MKPRLSIAIGLASAIMVLGGMFLYSEPRARSQVIGEIQASIFNYETSHKDCSQFECQISIGKRSVSVRCSSDEDKSEILYTNGTLNGQKLARITASDLSFSNSFASSISSSSFGKLSILTSSNNFKLKCIRDQGSTKAIVLENQPNILTPQISFRGRDSKNTSSLIYDSYDRKWIAFGPK